MLTKPSTGQSLARRCLFERLETRLNLAHVHGVLAPAELEVEGTSGPDRIELKFDTFSNSVVVTRNLETLGRWSIRDWNSVRVQSQQGDDQIYVDPNLPLPVTVDGGEGNDTLSGIDLGSPKAILFPAGATLAFNNRSCAEVECVQAEGETNTPSTLDRVAISPTDLALLFDALKLSPQDHEHSGAIQSITTAFESTSLHDHSSLAMSMSGNTIGGAADSVHMHDGPAIVGSTPTMQASDSNPAGNPTQRATSTFTAAGEATFAPGPRKVCLTSGTTINLRLDNAASVVRDVIPLKPGCS